jgi:ribosomal protein S18 acetylase RimI-like enzyme
MLDLRPLGCHIRGIPFVISDDERKRRNVTDEIRRECDRGVTGSVTATEYTLRRADEADAQAVAALVDAAYGHYVERIGFPPRPMTDDYTQVIRDNRVTVAETQAAIVGVIVLNDDDEGFYIDNVAVHPSRRGGGVGRSLLEFAEAEARRVGFDSIYLYTHEKMTENIALYSRIGYEEYDRRPQVGFSLVYMRKPLG